LATVTVDGSFALEQSPFDIVQVDVTHRCNMACSNCYIPNRDVPDLDAEWILRMLARLPPRRNIRLVGAEPTMRSDLPELIARVRELGHHVSILTNGLTIARREYLRELKDAGLRVVYLSMNGGCDDDAYEVVDGLRCAKKKIQAFENLAAEHMYSSIGIIVVPGVNEAQVGNLFRASAQNRGMRELHVRGVGAIGRHMDAPNQLKLEALREIVATQTGVPLSDVPERGEGSSYVDFDIGRLHMQITEWPDLGSKRRGRLTLEGTVAPFFEHVMANEGGY